MQHSHVEIILCYLVIWFYLVLYLGGNWTLRIEIPKTYPIHPPKIKFLTKICHPNISFKVGRLSKILNSILNSVKFISFFFPFNLDRGDMFRHFKNSLESCLDFAICLYSN